MTLGRAAVFRRSIINEEHSKHKPRLIKAACVVCMFALARPAAAEGSYEDG